MNGVRCWDGGYTMPSKGPIRFSDTPLFFNMHMDDIDDAHPIFNKLRDQVRVHSNLKTTVQC